ncbi:hypothetical protein ACIPL1_27580 [Pseudomonas sp. NPDC090202]|uniref:hypothetical protein n=1 Tax=Pseudomonas sp. NPDC090202 TaxID=3364476 RepID=UPI0037FFDEA1
MARASKPASDADKATKPVTRKAAAKPANAVDQQEAGAKAPVSLSGDQANGATQSNQPTGDGVQVDPVAAEPAPAVEPVRQVPPGGFFSPMGRFPEGWKLASTLPHERVQESAETAQTPAQEPVAAPVKSPAWGLPDIAEFPAELTLVNNTRHLLVVRPLNVRLMRNGGSQQVVIPTARHYAAIQHDFSARAVREQWDSDTGLQVKHGED